MKKILGTFVVSSVLLVNSTSPLANASVKPESSNYSNQYAKLESVKLPNLYNSKTAKLMKSGKISISTLSGKKVNFDSTFEDLENKFGKPLQKEVFENTKYITTQYSYNQNKRYLTPKFNVFFYGAANSPVDNYKKLKIEKINLIYTQKYTINSVEKYFGKARSQFKTGKKDSMRKIYSDSLMIDYKKIKGTWIVDRVNIESYLSPSSKELNKPTNE